MNYIFEGINNEELDLSFVILKSELKRYMKTRKPDSLNNIYRMTSGIGNHLEHKIKNKEYKELKVTKL